MARHDVHARRGRDLLVVDCQANWLRELETRVVIPLLPADGSEAGSSRLHPIVTVNDERFLLGTHLMTAIPARELGPPLASLADRSHEIVAAVDTLLTGV